MGMHLLARRACKAGSKLAKSATFIFFVDVIFFKNLMRRPVGFSVENLIELIERKAIGLELTS